MNMPFYVKRPNSLFLALLAGLLFMVGLQDRAAGQTTTFLTNGLVLYYPFNGNANDAIGTNNGVVFGAVLTNDMFGNPNHAYYFGGNSYIQIPTSTNVFGSEDFTISIWFDPLTYPNPLVNSQAACFLISKGQNNFELSTGSLTASNGMNFLPRYALGNNWYTPAGTFQTNVWQHVVAIYKPSAGTLSVYLNGTSLALSGPGTTPVGTDISVPARLGMRSDGTLAFTGYMEFVRIYNRALSSQEVTELFQFESGAVSEIVIAPVITIPGLAGEVFNLQYETNLQSGAWMNLVTNIVLQSNSFQYVDTNGIGQPRRFYRTIPQ